MATLTYELERRVLSVSEVTRNIRFTLEKAFSGIWIEGEITNFKLHSSGHRYFSLKDESSILGCVMFRTDGDKAQFELEDGLKVICFGRISVYSPRGQYQLYVERVEPKGLGALQLKFLKLKEKLEKEGLFDEARKRPIPFFASRIGVVTSTDGAALRDILHVLNRRHENAQILISPAAVQGAEAAPSIVRAIEDLNNYGGVDVIIVARGGGSLEDLWAFNEEVVARAIVASEIPVISAVGHEVDYTIADFVSDLRAPTPSAAAEIVLPEKDELLNKIRELKKDCYTILKSRVNALQEDLAAIKTRPCLKNPLYNFEIKIQKLDELKKRIQSNTDSFFRLQKEKILGLLGKLEALGPSSVLKRGFSITTRPDGTLVTRAQNLKKGDKLKIKLKEGSILSQVEEILP